MSDGRPSEAPGTAPSATALLTGDLGEHRDAFIRLAASASAAHDRFTFRDPAAALHFYDELVARGGADFAPPAGRLLLHDGQPAGMFAVIEPVALQRARLRGGLVFARSAQLRADPALGERLKRATTTFVRPQSTDGYLSRLAVAPEMAGRGLGRWLLDLALAATRELGLARCVLEVADDNTRAAALYRSAGFTEIGRASTTDLDSDATLGYVHMAYTV
jgi:ribosomal protein S18 acetylase RimI-like enzyme